MFGVDAKDIERLRAERKNFKVEDPRWEKVMGFLTGDAFEKGLFQVRKPGTLSTQPPCLLLMVSFLHLWRSQHL